MSKIIEATTLNAKENDKAVETTASTNILKERGMKKADETLLEEAMANVNAAPAASVEQPNTESCCPKGKTTVTAIIDGEAKEITLARTIYSMDKLKKNQEKLLEVVDKSKLLDEIFHFSTPEIFYQEGIELYDWNDEPIAEGTENVLVPIETSQTYWRFTFDDVLKHVQIHTFVSVEEYAQVTGTTDLFSRSRNTVEKMGVAALATGDETYKAVYELARRTGMPGSSAMAYLKVELKGRTTVEMSMGFKKKEIPVASRTYEEAFDLYQQICFTFTPAEAKKRYAIRAINTVIHAGGYSFETIMSALKSIPSDKIRHALLMDCGSKEACIANVFLKFIMETLQNKAA